MGMVAVTFKVMPGSADADLDAIKKQVKENLSRIKNIKLEQVEEKPVAFGLKCLEVLVTMPDTGGTDKIEEEIANVPGIESVNTEDVTLI